MIFIFRRDECFAALKKDVWMPFTRVCRRWRQVSFDTPYLWSEIDFSNPERVEVLLKRSKAYPLSVRADLKPAGSRLQKLFIEMIATRTLRRLDLSTDCGGVSHLLKHRREASAPSLKELQISCNPFNDEEDETPDFLWQDMPRLHTLTIRFLRMTSQVPRLPLLTGLTIDDHIHGTLTVSRTLQILQQTPCLMVAFLNKITGDRSPTSPQSFPHVNLPDLRLLNLRLEQLEQSIMLNYLSFPSTACVALSYGSRPENPDSMDISPIHRTWSLLASSVGQNDQVEISSVCGNFTIKLSNPSRSPRYPTVTIEHPLPIASFLPLIQGISNITLRRLEADSWSGLTPYAKTVEMLTLEDCRLRFLKVLRPPKRIDDDEELPLPMLKTIILSNYHLCHYGCTEHRKLSALLRVRKIDTVKFTGGSASYIKKNHFTRRNMNIQWEDTEFRFSRGFDYYETDGMDCSDEEEESESEYGSGDDGDSVEVDRDYDHLDDGL
ncbi:hypothetical protein ONZ45_g1315 [Pleurotus djamor]|nr:hypothetical protein ONZ45_g1315 [Pleurotus djamor]